MASLRALWHFTKVSCLFVIVWYAIDLFAYASALLAHSGAHVLSLIASAAGVPDVPQFTLHAPNPEILHPVTAVALFMACCLQKARFILEQCRELRRDWAAKRRRRR